MRENFMITKSIWFCFSLILFNHLWNVNATEFEERENDDFEFIDLGIRLTGAKRDPLIADLIAEEREFINAGHVNRQCFFFTILNIVCLFVEHLG